MRSARVLLPFFFLSSVSWIFVLWGFLSPFVICLMASFYGSKRAVHLQARFILHMCIQDIPALRDCIHVHITLTHGDILVIELIFSEKSCLHLAIHAIGLVSVCLYFCRISWYEILTETEYVLPCELIR